MSRSAGTSMARPNIEGLRKRRQAKQQNGETCGKQGGCFAKPGALRRTHLQRQSFHVHTPFGELRSPSQPVKTDKAPDFRSFVYHRVGREVKEGVSREVKEWSSALPIPSFELPRQCVRSTPVLGGEDSMEHDTLVRWPHCFRQARN